VIVLDIGMPGLNGLDLCRELRRKLKETAVLILTMYDDREFLARAIDNGASGYVVKGSPANELLQAIRAVARGQLYLPGGIPRDFLDRLRSSGEDPYNRLTARERQVFQMIAEGKTSRKIAEALSIAMKTVDAHRTRLMRKLSIHNVGELVKLALRRGVVRLPVP
jgi:DNA-binding NarL/FixJ family response regulator